MNFVTNNDVLQVLLFTCDNCGKQKTTTSQVSLYREVWIDPPEGWDTPADSLVLKDRHHCDDAPLLCGDCLVKLKVKGQRA